MKSMRNQGRDIPRFSINWDYVITQAAQNMPHEEDFDDNNYESIDETTV